MEKRCGGSRVDPHLMQNPTHCTIFTYFTTSLWQCANSSKMTQIDAAIAHLEAQNSLNYSEASRLFGIPVSTLSRRYRGKPTSRAEATSERRPNAFGVEAEWTCCLLNREGSGTVTTQKYLRAYAFFSLNFSTRFWPLHLQHPPHNISKAVRWNRTEYQ